MTVTMTTPATSAIVKQPDDSKGMSKRKMNHTLQICGKAATGDATDLPNWIQECAFKGSSNSYKLTVIKDTIMANV